MPAPSQCSRPLFVSHFTCSFFTHWFPSQTLGTAALSLWLLSAACLSAAHAEPSHCACSAAPVAPGQGWQHQPGSEEKETQESVPGTFKFSVVLRGQGKCFCFSSTQRMENYSTSPQGTFYLKWPKAAVLLLPWHLQVLSRFPCRADFEDYCR